MQEIIISRQKNTHTQKNLNTTTTTTTITINTNYDKLIKCYMDAWSKLHKKVQIVGVNK